MNDETYYRVIQHYFHQCGYLTDLWLTYTMSTKWHLLALEQEGEAV